jgi:hypothetical protein
MKADEVEALIDSRVWCNYKNVLAEAIWWGITMFS